MKKSIMPLVAVTLCVGICAGVGAYAGTVEFKLQEGGTTGAKPGDQVNIQLFNKETHSPEQYTLTFGGPPLRVEGPLIPSVNGNYAEARYRRQGQSWEQAGTCSIRNKPPLSARLHVLINYAHVRTCQMEFVGQ